MADLHQPGALLELWFGALDAGFADDAHRGNWFSADAAFDRLLVERFAPLIDAAHAGQLDHWLDDARGRLAFILACDQLPRNVFRGTARAFASDALALVTARAGLERRDDIGLAFDERVFFYMPFEHSESVADQHTCVGLFTHLRDQTPPGGRHLTGDFVRYAHQHRDIVLRFGRFPHRNAVLGRRSTNEELAFLETAVGFGQ